MSKKLSPERLIMALKQLGNPKFQHFAAEL